MPYTPAQSLAVDEAFAIVEQLLNEFVGQQISPELLDIIQARLDDVMPAVDAVKARRMPFFWLSFVDDNRPIGDQFIGACTLQAWDIIGTIDAAHDAGCNPGGEVEFQEWGDHAPCPPPDGYVNRLLSRDECAAVNEISAIRIGVLKVPRPADARTGFPC